MKRFPNRKLGMLLTAAAALTLPTAAVAGKKKELRPHQITPTQTSAAEVAISRDLSEGRPAIRKVRLSGDFFALRPAGGEVPAAIRDAKVKIDFGGQQPTFDDLLYLLEDRGLSVIMGWDDGSYGSDGEMPQAIGAQTPAPTTQGQTSQNGAGQTGEGAPANAAQVFAQAPAPAAAVSPEGLRGRPLPFRRYEGTLGGLFRQIQRSMGVTIWWNEGIYVSPVGRYSVMLPQNSALMNQVVSELRAKGARNVVASLQAGTVSFVAPGALAEEAIRPYLLRLGRNASEVTMQVALVTVFMNENASKGFDWSAFNFGFGGNGLENTGQSGMIGAGTGGTGGSERPRASLFSLDNKGFNLFQRGASILGVKGHLDIAGAIKFLSQWGNIAVDQNVELRTLAGTSVNWRSGETIPYVSGVSATTTGIGGVQGGFGGAVGAAQTEKLETGLTLALAPNYEANGGLVTVAFKLELTELIEFIQLNAGNQLGSFTQPRTREQKLDDIVRIPVGETVVLGGLRRQASSTDRTGPFGAYAIGSKGRKNEVQTTFIVLRPVVTVYEVAGLEQPMPYRNGEQMIGADGQPWARPADEYRGTNMFGGAVNGAGPVRTRSMAQPGKSGQ